MSNLSILQCERSWDFQPRQLWPAALPAMAFQRQLLTGFERTSGPVVDLAETSECSWLEAFTACHCTLRLGELARLMVRLKSTLPENGTDPLPSLLSAYGLRANERLILSLEVLSQTPREFHEWVDHKALSARDLSPLLALPSIAGWEVFLASFLTSDFTKSQGVQILEWVVELTLLGHPLADLQQDQQTVSAYMQCLERWHRPMSTVHDEEWRNAVKEWPWPAQVEGTWQRFGDQTGLEIKIRTTSPQDFDKKLQRLSQIRDSWSCKI